MSFASFQHKIENKPIPPVRKWDHPYLYPGNIVMWLHRRVLLIKQVDEWMYEEFPRGWLFEDIDDDLFTNDAPGYSSPDSFKPITT